MLLKGQRKLSITRAKIMENKRSGGENLSWLEECTKQESQEVAGTVVGKFRVFAQPSWV